MTPSDNALKEISKTLLSIDKSLKVIANHYKQLSSYTWAPCPSTVTESENITEPETN